MIQLRTYTKIGFRSPDVIKSNAYCWEWYVQRATFFFPDMLDSLMGFKTTRLRQILEKVK